MAVASAVGRGGMPDGEVTPYAATTYHNPKTIITQKGHTKVVHRKSSSHSGGVSHQHVRTGEVPGPEAPPRRNDPRPVGSIGWRAAWGRTCWNLNSPESEEML